MGITQQKPHAGGHARLKKFLTRFIAQKSDLILTHATEGVKMIEAHYPYAAGKIHFLHHPTKTVCRNHYLQKCRNTTYLSGETSHPIKEY